MNDLSFKVQIMFMRLSENILFWLNDFALPVKHCWFEPPYAVETLAVKINWAWSEVSFFPASQTAVFLDQRIEFYRACFVVGFLFLEEQIPKRLRADNVRADFRALF